MSYKTLPYTYDKTGEPFNRLIIQPIRIAEKVTDGGLINPEHESKFCEVGVVFSSCEGSEIKPGDEVLYNKIDRLSGEHMDTASIDGQVYDIVYEREIWSVNEKPFNRIFVEPLSDIQVSDGGVIIPREVKGVTEKGRVFLAPDRYGLQPGDKVEYRKQEGGIYPEVELNGIIYDVLFEADIFTVNGDVAPYRIIVKVDMAAQFLKRTTSASGLSLSPLFIAMLHNLQYAEVVEIGKEAKKLYPDLHAGNTAIMHHVIESQPYRLLAQQFGKHHGVTYEYRIINCWEEKSAEILGKLTYKKESGDIHDITPMHGDFFCQWNIRTFEQMNPDALLATSDRDLSQYTNLDDLKNAISHMKKAAAEKAKMRTAGLRLTLQEVDPTLYKDRFDYLQNELRIIQQEETRLSSYLRKDHLVVCKVAYPSRIPSYIIAFHEELYPINILGKKFIIAHPEFIIAQTTKFMDITINDITPLNGYVIVLPIEDKKETELVVPDSAKEKPQKGSIAAIQEVGDLKKGDVVLFRRHAGLEEVIDGKKYLILRKNDLLAVVPATI